MINKCGLDINTSRWGQMIIAVCASSQNNSWAGSSAKIKIFYIYIFFGKRKAFYHSSSWAQIEIPLTPYRAVEIFIPILLFKWQIDCGLGSRSDSMAVKAVPGQGWNENFRGEMSPSMSPMSLPASPWRPYWSQSGAGHLQGPPVSTQVTAFLCQYSTCWRNSWLYFNASREKFTRSICGDFPLFFFFFLKRWLHHGKESLQKPAWAARGFVHPLTWPQSWNETCSKPMRNKLKYIYLGTPVRHCLIRNTSKK